MTFGIVLGQQGGRWLVRTPGGQVEALTAAEASAHGLDAADPVTVRAWHPVPTEADDDLNF